MRSPLYSSTAIEKAAAERCKLSELSIEALEHMMPTVKVNAFDCVDHTKTTANVMNTITNLLHVGSIVRRNQTSHKTNYKKNFLLTRI